MNKSSLHKKAFTLVELIIVIVIIGILVSAIFLSYTNYSWKARDANRISDLWNIKEVIENYYKTDYYDLGERKETYISRVYSDIARREEELGDE